MLQTPVYLILPWYFAVFSARRGYRDKYPLGSRNFAVVSLSGLGGGWRWVVVWVVWFGDGERRVGDGSCQGCYDVVCDDVLSQFKKKAREYIQVDEGDWSKFYAQDEGQELAWTMQFVRWLHGENEGRTVKNGVGGDKKSGSEKYGKGRFLSRTTL
ncbi:hypothetical protein TREMEDRAFT_63245 [Tremella mesenterica DSM 1558]|uniref:uncharacterized protein n=1 Tax=Tremella mesenterica (strain ATCC 24925 / CBS 8224 / DSM 1558 / NBRC 9311 / NRRL Y-6157 / RJB 2259-6 / UBC 559-6) TaxID=578456 RepID=UPI0003F49F05|nr:uncharacterized protein TREMEDRAFT_63245 [Tremella mesenterica DSM 1558]EIW68784.1 hypothetical protein TREMEDRAFT_63245 [Tremella mesenterica DSM 1558]